jgi:diguanylate cyclase (GGDEF)-like protein
VIQETIKYLKRYPSDTSLILIDLDFFKNINDVYGHLTGDKVLKEFAKVINQNIRDVDTFARWGGEEFIILLHETNLASAKQFAERIKEIVYDHNFEIDHRVSVSIGVSQYADNDTIDTWIQRADDALYLAKRHGRNRVESI